MKPALLCTFTWSGRGKGNSRKNPFENYSNIHKLMYSILYLVDKTYSMNECIEDMKKKIFKYAYLKTEPEDELLVVTNTENIISQVSGVSDVIVTNSENIIPQVSSVSDVIFLEV